MARHVILLAAAFVLSAAFAGEPAAAILAGDIERENLVEASTNGVAEIRVDQPEAKPRRFIETKIYKLNHTSAEDVAERFNSMWNGEFGQTWVVKKMAVAFPESNTLMVTAPPVIQEACEHVISEIDIEAPQVYIEARFVELGNTASRKVGIDWSMLGGMKGAMNLGGGAQVTEVGEAVSEYSRSFGTKNDASSYKISGENGRHDGDVTYFNGTLNFSEMYLVLKALDATEDAKMFSNPKIIVSSGKKATVDMTDKYPNVNISAKRTTASGSDSLDLSMQMAEIPGEDKFMFAKEAFFSWGIELEVTPRIGTNGLINVSIVPTISSQTDWVTSGAGDTVDSNSSAGTYSSKYPVLNVKRLITEFNMKSGSTAVIGGLSKTVETQVDNGIPLLRSIPWIGPRLFGSMERVKEQREIIVFVTVGLVNPREMMSDVGLPKNAILGRQYVNGQKLEPGDRPERNMEGFDSLDLRLLEEQAKDPLNTNVVERTAWDLRNLMPFQRESSNNTNNEGNTRK